MSDICPICGDEYENGFEALEGKDGQTLRTEKVCVVEFPEKAIIHFEEGEL